MRQSATTAALLALLAVAAPAAGQSPTILMWYRIPQATLPPGFTLGPGAGNQQWISPDGAILLHGFLVGPGVSEQALCLWTPQGPVVVARQNAPAPGAGAYLFSGFDQVAAAGAAGAVFRAGLTSSGQPSLTGMYLFDGAPQPCLLAGQAVPGWPGLVVNGFLPASSNGHGAVVTASTGPGPTTFTGSGVWAGTPAAFGLVAHKGEQPAGMPAGRIFQSFSNSPAMNPAGAIAFDAVVAPAPLTEGIWLGTPAAPSLVVQSGDPAPGMPARTFLYVYSPVLNSAGDLLFEARVGDGTEPMRESLWLRSGAAMSAVVVQGDPAPGTDAVFATFGQPAGVQPSSLLMDDGTAVFYATLSGPTVTTANDLGIFAAAAGAVRLIAREGDRAPGLPPGSLYQGLPATGFTWGGFAADGRGNIAFTAQVTGVGPALFVSDRSGRADLLLRNGIQVPTGPGVLETLNQFTLTRDPASSLSGRPTYLSQNGELVMQIRTSSQTYGVRDALAMIRLGPACPANCDRSTAAPVLNVNDFTCFLNRFAAGDPWANCDGSTVPPVLNVNDFVCFLGQFAAGCP